MPEVASLFCSNRNHKEAFTLLELLIVILLLSLMALLVFGTMSHQRFGVEKPGVSQIRELVKKVPAGGEELICIDDCRQCFLRTSDREMHPVTIAFKPLTAYTVNLYGEARRIDFGRFRDRKICLRFRFRDNGSSSRMIIETEGKYYFIPSYFGKTELFSSLVEATSYWLRNSELLRNIGDYY